MRKKYQKSFKCNISLLQVKLQSASCFMRASPCFIHAWGTFFHYRRIKKKKEEADFPTWRAASIAPLLGTHANVFLSFCAFYSRLYGSFSSQSVWHLKQKQQWLNEGAAVAGRGCGRPGDCFCHCCLHCLLDIDWHLLKCHDMTQTNKEHFLNQNSQFVREVGGANEARHLDQLQHLKGS